MVGQREFCGELLVDIDAESGGLVYVHVAVFDSGTSGEDFSGFVIELDGIFYLDTYVIFSLGARSPPRS